MNSVAFTQNDLQARAIWLISVLAATLFTPPIRLAMVPK